MKSTAFVSTTLLATTALPAFAATYTVKQDGTGDYTTIQACADVAQAGDTCVVSAGTYSGGVSPAHDGSAGAWITFQAEAGATPEVTGAWDLEGRHYIVIDGFEVGGGFSSSTYSGQACSNIQILNNYINGATIGVGLKGDDVLISGNTFDDMADDMVREFGDRWTIRNNIVIDETDSNDEHMDFWQSWCNPAGMSASFVLIENNEFIDVSGGNVHFTLVNGTESCGDPVTNMIYRYNKVRNIGSLGIYIDNNQQTTGCRDNSVYNNTFMDLSGGDFAGWQDYAVVFSASDSSSGLNNIFYNAVDSDGATGFLFAADGFQDYNLYFDPAATMTFSGAASSEPNAIKNEDPLLTDASNNDFSLLDGSPAIDQGGPLTHVATADSGSGTALVVDEAEFFQPGWGGADPDTIAVGSPSNTAQIASIDYAANTITLADALTRSAGDAVYLYRDSDGTVVLIGAAPDIGAVEWGSAGAGGSGGSVGGAGTGGTGAAGGTNTGGAAVGGGGAGALGATAPEDDGGCGCRSVRSGGNNNSSAWLALLAGMALVGRRRRQ